MHHTSAQNFDPAAARDRLLGWLTAHAWQITRPQDLVRETCDRLVAAGVPIDVFNAWVLLLHPDYFGVQHRWEAASGEVSSQLGTHEIFNTGQVQASPLSIIRDTEAAAYRRQLWRDGADPIYPVLQDYLDDGYTDYLVMRLYFSDDTHNSISFATRQPGGFSAEQLSVVDSVLFYMARLTEVQAVRYLATVLLDTYVGRNAGGEIMRGNIRRGHGRSLRAAVLMTDLQGFTTLSNRLPRDDLIAHLNSYFDAFGQPVQAAGGEILKFIGDAMLAIFPVDADNEAERIAAALTAVREGFAEIDRLNTERRVAGQAEFACGAALHIGDVSYGNIGAGTRLDFTVIGPAVNLVARLEALTRPLGERVLLSADVAAIAGAATESLGRHQAKGFDAPIEVFRLA